MSFEMTMLGWTLVLAMAQIFLAAAVMTKDFGLDYNMSARDATTPPLSELGGRLRRAQANLFETLPLFAAAVLIAHIAGRESALTRLGAGAFLAARVVYLPLYAAGVPVVRTLAWGVSIVGLVLILAAILRPA